MTSPGEIVKERLKTSSNLKGSLVEEELVDSVAEAGKCIGQTLRNGGKILTCGNGGSSAQSQHLATELVGNYQIERPGLAAVSLASDASLLTSIANDFGFESVFARQVEGLGKPEDVLMGFTTSGTSANVLEAFKKAKQMGLTVIAVVGENVEAVSGLADICISVPCDITAYVQEVHLTVIHAICDIVESGIKKDA